MMESLRDTIGRENEFNHLEFFREIELGKYISYHNKPYSPTEWKKTRGNGVDFVFTIGEFKIYIEDRFNCYRYPYRKKWVYKTVFPHFRDCPIDYFNRRILLTNRPENYDSVKDLVKKFGVKIMNLEELVYYLREIIILTKSLSFTNPSIDNILNTLSNNQLRVTSIQENKDETLEFININELEKDRQSKKLEKLKKLKEKYPYLLRIPESWLV